MTFKCPSVRSIREKGKSFLKKKDFCLAKSPKYGLRRCYNTRHTVEPSNTPNARSSENP